MRSRLHARQVGPWEVFTASAMLHERAGDEPDTVVTIAATRDAVRCAKGLRVLPDHDTGDHPALDVVLVPGGQGTRREVDDAPLMRWLADVGAAARWVTSVCTGSLLLWRSGLAKGRRVATHHAFEDILEGLGDVTVVRDARWVRDGNVVTSQGVSAGIDMALWLTGQLHDRAHARATQRGRGGSRIPGPDTVPRSAGARWSEVRRAGMPAGSRNSARSRPTCPG